MKKNYLLLFIIFLLLFAIVARLISKQPNIQDNIIPTISLPTTTTTFPIRNLSPTNSQTFIIDKQRCADYIRNQIKEQYCAVCGDGVCHPFEKCTSSNCSDNKCTTDCGGLYCREDCEK